MDDAALQRIIDELAAAPREREPRIQFQSGKPKHLFAVANRDGLVYLAHLFLEAAVSPLDTDMGGKAVHVDPEFQEEDNQDDLTLATIERAAEVPMSPEVLEARRSQSGRLDGVLTAGCVIGVLLLIFLLISGVIFWGAVLTGNWK